MTGFLKEKLSEARFATYQELSSACSMHRSPQHLYALNIKYFKELYVVLSGLEVAVRNSFNDGCQQCAEKDDWVSSGFLLDKHKKQMDAAVEHVSREKKDKYVFDDIVAQLNYGFWVNLCNSLYEQKLWNKALYKCFPHLGQKPNRRDIRKRLERTLQLRNKIAHLEPIIKNEEF